MKGRLLSRQGRTVAHIELVPKRDGVVVLISEKEGVLSDDKLSGEGFLFGRHDGDVEQAEKVIQRNVNKFLEGQVPMAVACVNRIFITGLLKRARRFEGQVNGLEVEGYIAENVGIVEGIGEGLGEGTYRTLVITPHWLVITGNV